MKTDSFTSDDLRVMDLIGWDIDYTHSQSTSLDTGASLVNANRHLQSGDDFKNQLGAEAYQETYQIIEPQDEGN